jgi:glycosyltransferase involved in cell wall biosynthesis
MKKILLVADGRSPITRRWISGILKDEWEIHLLSTFPCQPVEGVASLNVIPLAFNAFSGTASGNLTAAPGWTGAKLIKSIAGRFRGVLIQARYLINPLAVMLSAKKYQQMVEEIHPDLVHALRIPFEGMLASYTPAGYPLVVSTWGNDFTLHAGGSWLMRKMTVRCMRRANGLVSDACRDLRLGINWGFDPQRPGLFVPGSGGLDIEEIQTHSQPLEDLFDGESPSGLLVVNPRGIRPAYVRNDTFFAAIPLVVDKMPEVRFVCPSMRGQREAEQWVKKWNIERYVYLLPNLPQKQLWEIFNACAVVVSPAIHDGTPNSLIEAMACGCFPIAGDLESIRQWIVPGKTGLLVDPTDPRALADAILMALRLPELRKKAAKKNSDLILDTADVKKIRRHVLKFYDEILKNQPDHSKKHKKNHRG